MNRLVGALKWVGSILVGIAVLGVVVTVGVIFSTMLTALIAVGIMVGFVMLVASLIRGL